MKEIAKRVKELFFVEDYYAVQAKNATYYPHRMNGKLVNITESKILDSILRRTTVLGVYSTSQEDMCKWMVIDFDIDTGRDEVFRARQNVFEAYKKCVNLGLTPYIESSGNKGYHLWVLYNKVSASTAYKAINYLGRGYKGEKYPMQPSLKEKNLEFGNLVRLPCSINQKSKRPSQWLDLSFNPQKDQLEYFMKLKRTPIEAVEKVADLYKEEIKIVNPFEELTITKRKVDIKHGLFKIDGRGRHAIQFQLIMKCIEADMSKDETLKTGIEWLKLYNGQYKSNYNDALIDFRKGLNYAWSRK